MHPHVTVSLYNNDKKEALGFGRGIIELLERIQHSGSIYQAAKEMGMAYSKAWNILRTTESEFGCKLLKRNGQRGSELTEDAEKLMELYRAMLCAAEEAANNVFQNHTNS